VCEVGSRFAALEPISQGLQRIYGSVEADAARGLSLRMDHGSQYLPDHFQKQIRFWGITPSFDFIEEPETNGVAVRFNRTLKEQSIHGQILRSIENVRKAVRRFVEGYNAHSRPDKLKYKTPVEARQQCVLRHAGQCQPVSREPGAVQPMQLRLHKTH
jgi:transposase InsO family protein